MERSELQAEVPYLVTSADMYFWSPDGVGGYWYDTREEMDAQHGTEDESVIIIEELLDY